MLKARKKSPSTADNDPIKGLVDVVNSTTECNFYAMQYLDSFLRTDLDMEQQISGKIEEFIARLSIDTTFGGRRFITEDGELPSPVADDKPKAPITIDMSVKATGTAETGDIADLVKSKTFITDVNLTDGTDGADVINPVSEESARNIPLPESLPVKSAVELIINQQPWGGKKTDHPKKKEWVDLLKEELHGKMVTDTFNWFYWDYSKAIPGIQHLLDPEFKDKQAAGEKDKLFLHLSMHYVDLLEKIFLWQDKDSFLWNYPQLLAQTIFYLFQECYPKLSPQLNTEFQAYLFKEVTYWFFGIKIQGEQYTQWTFGDAKRSFFDTRTRNMLTMNTQITDNGQQQQQRSQPQQQVGKNKTTFFDKVEDFIQTMDRTERQWNRINNPHGAAREQTPSKDEGRQDLLERMRERQREAAELQAVEMAHRANELSTKEGQSPPAQQTRLDIFANSPLFQRYLASIKLGRYHGKPFTVKHLVNADQTNRDKLYLPNGQKRRTYYEILEENSRQSKEYRRQFEQDKSAVDQVRRESQKLFRSNVIRLRRLYDKIRTDRKALREFSDIIRDARGKQNDKVFWEKLSEHQHLYASKESVCAATGTNSRNASRPPTQSTAGTRK